MAEQVVGRQGGYYLSGLNIRAAMANELGKRDEAMALFAEGMAIAVGKGATSRDWLPHCTASMAVCWPPMATRPPPFRCWRMPWEAQSHPKDVPALPFAKGALGDAYDQVGNTGKARALLLAARMSGCIRPAAFEPDAERQGTLGAIPARSWRCCRRGNGICGHSTGDDRAWSRGRPGPGGFGAHCTFARRCCRSRRGE